MSTEFFQTIGNSALSGVPTSLRSWRIKGGGRERGNREKKKNEGEKKGRGDWGKEEAPAIKAASFELPPTSFA